MMRDLIISIFGVYTPPTVPIGDGVSIVDVVPAGIAGIDFVFLSGVFLFGIVLFCFLRIVGGLIKNV